MLLLIPIALLAGVITVFTPCILPVLPIILAGGTTAETKRKPYAIVVGLVTTFTAFTLAGAWIFSQLHIGSKRQLQLGAVMLLIVAATLIVPKAAELLERPFLFLTRRRTGELGGGFFLGASLGLVFVPCAGPVFTAVSVNAGRHRVGVETVAVAISYAVGAALPMLAIARGSRRIALSFRAHAQRVRVLAGVVMALGAVAIYEGWEQRLQKQVPGYANALQNWIEGNGYADRRLAALQGRHGVSAGSGVRLARSPLRDYGRAPDFTRIAHWLNTPAGRPLSLASLRGKVVLIDFWTYSCINCLRTLPHTEAWDKMYRARGLVVVGVHTPEFAFEHDLGNVSSAVARYGVHYAVALDNGYGTWDAYGNQYWPAEYLIDRQGHVRHLHFGEDDYGGTERAIRLLLKENPGVRLPAASKLPDQTPTELMTPESYLGTERIARYVGTYLHPGRPFLYHFAAALPQDDLTYAGRWLVGGQEIDAVADARLRIRFRARDIYLVLGGRGRVQPLVDGRPLPAVDVTGYRLYTLLAGARSRVGLLELRFARGVRAYAFTFG